MKAVIAYILVCLSVLFLAPSASAQAPAALQLDPDVPVANADRAMWFAADSGQTLQSLKRRFQDGELSQDFAAVGAQVVPYQAIWGLVSILAPGSGGDGKETSRVLVSRIHGLIVLDVFLLRSDGRVEQLLAHDIRMPFSPKDYSINLLRSAPADLEPGEAAVLAVRMVHGAIEEVDFSLESPSEHASIAFSEGLKLVAFYAFLGACLVFFIVFSLALGSDVEFSYALLLLLGLAFVAYLDNFPFRWLYPESPGLHLPFGLVLLLVLVAQGFFTAGLSLKRYASGPSHQRLFFVACAITLACISLVFLLPAEIVAPVTYLMMVAMLAAQVYCVFRWDAFEGARRRVVRWVMFVTIVGFSLSVLLAIARTGVGEISIPWLIKGVYTTLAFGIMAGLSTGLIELRREHAEALAREIEAVRKEAAIARDLLKAEQDYSRARDLADRRRLQLASMSHDIKQPLSALRLTVEAMTRDDPTATRARLEEAFDYIEDLTLGHLEETRAEAEQGSLQDAEAVGEPDTDPYEVSLILDTVDQMFSAEARSKGLDLRIVNSSAQVLIQPLVLMRIVSNLVSNAIKYTGSGRVLTGVRRRGDCIVLQVIDTGPGMSAAELTRYRQAWQSGTDSEGHGLGLAICAELAAKHGLVLDAWSEPGRGTVFSLSIPVSPGARDLVMSQG
ncbi:sensor histidine kinase [Roseibium sp. Sym1]|uniref:sensor histidine kinase n=1 Tax=Roseibium sp. Sym1 TaxID=3016006 RepID=UPI0022B45203|nr:HAMP domain-containing sensor histidine kinase [Roseibium sp. Sym1]